MWHNGGMSAPQHPQQPQYPQNPQQPPPAKKGTPIWVWLLVGFFGLALMVVAAAGMFMYWAASKVKEVGANPGTAIVKMIAAANPDIDVIDSDEKAGKITVRDKKTGKVVTIDMDSVKDGKISIETDEGKAVFGGAASVKAPDWVFIPPGATVQGGFTSTNQGRAAGSIVVQSKESVTALKAMFEEKYKSAGYDSELSVATSGSDEGAHLQFQHKDRKRNVIVSLGKSPEGSMANIAYSEEP